MKAAHSILAVMTIALGLSAPAGAGNTDPEIILYRFPGVRDNGGATNTGVATSFHCTNFSGTPEAIRFVVRGAGAAIVANIVTLMFHLDTITASTHQTALFGGAEVSLNTGTVAQGTAAIAVTSINVICTGMIVDAASSSPVGIALRGIRFNPAPGTQE